MQDQTSAKVTKALLSRWVYIHGTPYFILSDQGSSVNGELISSPCNPVGIEKRYSSAYHSQRNEFAEQSIRSIKDMLRAAL